MRNPTEGFSQRSKLDNDIVFCPRSDEWTRSENTPPAEREMPLRVVRWLKGWVHRMFKGDYNVTIIGIRTGRVHVDGHPLVSNKFQDWMVVTYPVGTTRVWYVLPATTLAGMKYYETPMNRRGTAQLPSKMHKALWEQGLHKGKRALVQANKVEVVRDADGDKYHDWDGEIYRGNFGINFHTANEKGTSTQVDGWSAGCQVTNISQVTFEHLLNTLAMCEQFTGYKTYSYLLLDDTNGTLDPL